MYNIQIMSAENPNENVDNQSTLDKLWGIIETWATDIWNFLQDKTKDVVNYVDKKTVWNMVDDFNQGWKDIIVKWAEVVAQWTINAWKNIDKAVDWVTKFWQGVYEWGKMGVDAVVGVANETKEVAANLASDAKKTAIDAYDTWKAAIDVTKEEAVKLANSAKKTAVDAYDYTVDTWKAVAEVASDLWDVVAKKREENKQKEVIQTASNKPSEAEKLILDTINIIKQCTASWWCEVNVVNGSVNIIAANWDVIRHFNPNEPQNAKLLSKDWMQNWINTSVASYNKRMWFKNV